MKRKELRQWLEVCWGTELFEKFLSAYNRENRRLNCLSYWQEQLLQQFEAETSFHLDQFGLTHDEIFGICPVHRCELEADEVPIRYGLLNRTPTMVELNRQFPFANTYVSGGCEIQDEYQAAVVYCARCRDGLLKAQPPIQPKKSRSARKR